MNVTVDSNDLIAAYRQRCFALTEECAMQASLIAELQRQKQALAEEVKKLKLEEAK